MVSYRTDFLIRFLLKFEEVTDVKQHFYELKQCQLKKTDPKIRSCEPALVLHNCNDKKAVKCDFLSYRFSYPIFT